MVRILVTFLVINIVRSYNIEHNFPTFLQPDTQLGVNGENSGYFGYNLQIDSGPNNALKFLIGSPKSRNTSNEEKFYRCPKPNFRSQTPSCTPIRSPIESNDLSGLTISAQNQQDLLACYPSRIHQCADIQVQPGFCYRRSRNSEMWRRVIPNDTESVCPNRTASNLDLIFLLDGSGSVLRENFELIRRWVASVSTGFNISEGKNRIGVLQYSTYFVNRVQSGQPNFRVEIELGSVTDEESFNRTIRRIPYLMGATYTASALNFSVEAFKRSDRYTDPSTTKVLVLLTDGRATRPQFLNVTASYVRSLGINVFAIGVGNADEDELKLIATGTDTDENVYSVNTFTALNGIINQLSEGIRSFALEGTGNSNASSATSNLALAETGFSAVHSRELILHLLSCANQLQSLSQGQIEINLVVNWKDTLQVSSITQKFSLQ